MVALGRPSRRPWASLGAVWPAARGCRLALRGGRRLAPAAGRGCPPRAPSLTLRGRAGWPCSAHAVDAPHAPRHCASPPGRGRPRRPARRRDHRAGRRVGVVADRHRRDERRVDAHRDALADRGAVLAVPS